MNLFSIEQRNEQPKQIEKVLSNNQIDVLSIQLGIGEKIPEHDAPYTVLVTVQYGKVLFTVGETEVELSTNSVLYLEAKEKHSLKAIENCGILVLKVK